MATTIPTIPLYTTTYPLPLYLPISSASATPSPAQTIAPSNLAMLLDATAISAATARLSPVGSLIDVNA